MRRSRSHSDAIRRFQREEITARRAGRNRCCESCGEMRLEALVRGSKPTTCVECRRTLKGQTIMDKHHVAGRANSSVTVPIPVNDHRAVLSVAQFDWPRKTLTNSAGVPACWRAAGSIRGSIDLVYYLIETSLRWIAEMLEILSVFAREKLGSQWWINTPLAHFSLERKKQMSLIKSLPISVRVYPEPAASSDEKVHASVHHRNTWRRPDAMLVFDTETGTDETQRLTFGSHPFIRRGTASRKDCFLARICRNGIAHFLNGMLQNIQRTPPTRN